MGLKEIIIGPGAFIFGVSAILYALGLISLDSFVEAFVNAITPSTISLLSFGTIGAIIFIALVIYFKGVV